MFSKNKAETSAGKLSRAILSKNASTPFFQRGSILIGLIITMVVMAVLGLGMLYMTTTSAFNELFFSSNSEAASLAESGGRYAIAFIREAYSQKNPSKAATINNQTFTLSDGSSFQIVNMVQTTSATTGSDTITFSSIGTVGSFFTRAQRQMAYSISPGYQGGIDLPLNYKEKDMNNFTTPTGWGTSTKQTTDGNTVLAVTNAVPEAGGSSQEYRFYAYYSNPLLTFSQYQFAQGGTLGYDAQLKVKSTTDYFVAGLAFRTHALKAHFATDPAYNANDPRGFNLTIMRTGGDSTGEGIPLELTENSSGWEGLLYSTSNIEGNYYIILWADTGMNGVNSSSAPQERLLAYKKLDANSGVFTQTVPFSDDMESGINGWSANPEGASGGWTQSTSSYASATHSWLANLGRDLTSTLTSKQIDASAISTGTLSFSYSMPNINRANTPTVRICTGPGGTNCGSSLAFSPSENSSWHAVSIPVSGLTSTTYIKFTATTQDRNGAAIQLYIDDVKLSSTPSVVWPTLLVRLEEKNIVDGDDSSRRNIIKAYYSTPTANPTGNTTTGHTTFFDDNRLGSNPIGTFNWPAASGASDNNFTIIKWDWIRTDSFTTGCTNPLVVDASGTVLTTKYFLTKDSRTVDASDPLEACGRFKVLDDINYDEVGLNVFGINADNNIYFDDFAINISSGGGSSGSGEIIVYP